MIDAVAKVRAVERPEKFDPNGRGVTRALNPVTVRTKSGRQFTNQVQAIHGDQNDPLSHAEIVEKFLSNAGRLLAKEEAAAVLSSIENFEQADIRELMHRTSRNAVPGARY
jgi:2-methylcitrate dehydratase PrpD